jgi:hypothetical protein
MLDMLPEQDQNLAFEVVRKMVLAWDPDYTKLTPSEREALEESECEVERGETVSHNEINWN